MEGAELVLRGDILMAKMGSRSGSGRKLPPDPPPPKPLPPSQPEKTWTAPSGYRISDDTKNTSNGWEIKIRIEDPGEELPDGDQLKAVWRHVHAQVNRKLIVSFYLPEMPFDGCPWSLVFQDKTGKPTGYRIADTKNTSNGWEIKIRIEDPGEELPDGDQLEAVWRHVYAQVNRKLILTFYLPEMPLDGDPWAVVRQHGKLGIKATIYTENTPPKYRPK